MERTWRVRQLDRQGVCIGTVLTILIMLNSVSSQPDADGLCSSPVRSTVTYTTTYQVSSSQRTTTKCGFFNWSRCTAYRTVYYAEPHILYRDVYNLIFACCDGWETQADGSCNRITTERASTEPEASSKGTLDSNTTTPTFPADMLSQESSSSVSPSSLSSSGSPPVAIALPNDVSSNKNPSFLEDTRMLGGIGSVAAALIIMVTLMLLLVSRRRRRSREKKRNAEPGVLFELLANNSPAQGPTRDIYTEIPDPQNNTRSTGQETVTVQGESDYDIAFVHNQRPSGRVNTYQDVKDLVTSCNGINDQKQTAVGKGGASVKMDSPAAMQMESNVCFGQNGQVYTKLDQKGIGKADQVPYQNLTGLDTVIKVPVAYGNGSASPATSYNKLERTNHNRVVPTDQDDEAYNTVIIGPAGSEDATYDKLERQKSAPHHGSQDHLGVSIPVAAGYEALGVNGNNLAYDKLERHEAQGFDPDRHVGKTGSNAYDEISATSHEKTYDKLQRQHSADRGLNDSPSKAKPSDELPKSDNEYDTVEIGSPAGQPDPAGGEIYQNLPKKRKEKGLNVTIPSPDLNTETDSTLGASPVVRLLYDTIPGSPRMFNAPVYDVVPTSPRENGVAPVYDIPPALSQPVKGKESFEVLTSPVNNGGTRPVYDTPPLRLDNTSPLQFEETCPVYENTPTSRKQSIY